MKVKSESEVTQSCPTLSDPMDCSLTGSSVHGIFKARVLEYGAIAFSKYILHYSTNTKSPEKANLQREEANQWLGCMGLERKEKRLMQISSMELSRAMEN